MTGETAIILADLPVTPCLLLCHPSRLGFPFCVFPVSPVTPEKEEPLHADEILRGGDALALSYKAGRIWLYLALMREHSPVSS